MLRGVNALNYQHIMKFTNLRLLFFAIKIYKKLKFDSQLMQLITEQIRIPK